MHYYIEKVIYTPTMKEKKLSDSEIICLSNLTLIDVRRFKSIYDSMGIDAINIIACNNLFFMINDLRIAKEDDLFHIAQIYDRRNGRRIVKKLFKWNLYHHSGCYYYSKTQLDIIGYPMSELDNDRQHYDSLKSEGRLIFPTMELLSKAHYARLYRSLHRKLNADLPPYIAEKLKSMPEKMYYINVGNFVRVINYFLSQDCMYIGIKRFFDIQFKVVRKNEKMFIRLLRYLDIWKIDSRRKIFYDPVKRRMRGLRIVPRRDEVVYARNLYGSKIFNLLMNY